LMDSLANSESFSVGRREIVVRRRMTSLGSRSYPTRTVPTNFGSMASFETWTRGTRPSRWDLATCSTLRPKIAFESGRETVGNRTRAVPSESATLVTTSDSHAQRPLLTAGSAVQRWLLLLRAPQRLAGRAAGSSARSRMKGRFLASKLTQARTAVGRQRSFCAQSTVAAF
jgi:hypothetical protein